jgi:hypothetical protein
LDPRLAAMCVVATDWYEFAQRVVESLTGRVVRLTPSDRRMITDLFAAETVYAPLEVACRSFFGQKVPVA